jgi:hypothetical protein
MKPFLTYTFIVLHHSPLIWTVVVPSTPTQVVVVIVEVTGTSRVGRLVGLSVEWKESVSKSVNRGRLVVLVRKVLVVDERKKSKGLTHLLICATRMVTNNFLSLDRKHTFKIKRSKCQHLRSESIEN